MNHKISRNLSKFIHDQQGKFTLEISILFPLLVTILLSAILITSHVYSLAIQSYLVNRGAIQAVNTASYYDAHPPMRLRRYVQKYNHLIFVNYSALLNRQKSSQEFTNPILRLRQINQINSLFKNGTTDLDEQSTMKYPLIFSSHTEAAEFLRVYVDGQKLQRNTPYGNRLLDAYTNMGILHQAFVTYTESQLLLQAKKDEWLLNNHPEIKGVIWHFYMRQEIGYKKPSNKLLVTLKKMGIIAYVHIPK